ncbi:L-lactate permease [Granulicella sp. S190]|uniref:L-lactate permease n=1 Tax=Granulicella sp. S190 TaxID=1747226 RepID=UPI001C20BE07|nr:lactate permease LctP family transporter [Granulicella sp. S190]
MIWNQSYFLFGHGLIFSVVLASLPVLTLLVLLGVMRKPAWVAGLSGLAITLLLATVAYGMPLRTAISAAANGAAFGILPISWIVFWAIVLFHVTVETGHFEIIKDSVGRLTPDCRLQALLIAFAFGGFLEGAAGFGTPVAIASTMLIGLGFTAFSASAICLLANTAPVAFGSIGIPIITLAGTTGLPLDKLSVAVGRICTPMSLLIPAYLIVAMGGFGSLSGIWAPTLIAGGVFAIMQLFVSTYLGPHLTDIFAAIATIAALVLWFRTHRSSDQNTMLTPSAADSWRRFACTNADGTSTGSDEERKVPPAHSTREILYAWLPYALLVVCVLLWGWAPFQSILNKATILIHWPYLDNVVQRVPPIVANPTPYHAIYNLNLLSASGTACMTASLLSALCLKMRPRDFLRVIGKAINQLKLPTVTVTSVLALAFLMNYCGATATLGLAFSATGRAFPFFSALLGWIGVFLTGSDTSANALFGNLQVVTAGRLGFDPVLMAAANSSGGVMGKMISLQTIAVAAAATGLTQAEQSKLFRFTLKHSILLACIVGLVTMLYTYVFHL